MANKGTPRPLLMWDVFLENAPIPGAIWSQLYALAGAARRHPDAIPVLKVDTREGSVIVMDPDDFQQLVEGRPNVRDRR